jgi:hypothetical protein
MQPAPPFQYLRCTQSALKLAHPTALHAPLPEHLHAYSSLAGVLIVGLKVLNAAGSGDASTIIAALSWLLETSLDGITPNPGGATNAQQLSIGVVNLSLAFGVNSDSRELADAVCELLARLEQEAGVVSVSAAGERLTSELQALNGVASAEQEKYCHLQ